MGKAFEATCHVEWADAGGECAHDFDAPCPFGWYLDGDICVAPLGYEVCSSRKSFAAMTPAAKQDWASNCQVEFPCRDRSICKKSYSASCPADWYALNGGMSCAAPREYDGPCVPVLHGLADLTLEDKAAMERKC